MSGSGREALSDVREWSEAVRMSVSGREAPLEVREWSGGPLGCLVVVVRLSRMSRSGREALPNVQE